MSLINEALKKAQQDRPEMTPAPPPGGPMPPPHQPSHPPKRKHRGFLWGFLLAVVLVGGVSSLLAAFLVLQLIDPSPSPKPASPEIREVEPPSPEQRLEVEVTPVEAEPDPDTVAIQPPEMATKMEVPVTVEDTPGKISPAEETPPAAILEALPEPAREPEPVVEKAPPVTPVPQSPPEASLPNPQVVNRLRDFEIRGLMSGATKVLIFDSSTGKTRVYKAGESMEDPLGLSIHSISTNSVKFKDYAGHIHTKSF